jgi:polyisoprenoid-binding protein YceI
MKKSILILASVVFTGVAFGQLKTTTSATVLFDATTSLDKLPKAENKTVIAAVDTKSGAVEFEAPVKNFAFSNPRIQEHFNGDRWMNSAQFANFTFKGNLVKANSVNFEKDGTYNTEVEGVLNIKGVEQKIKVPATVVISGGSIVASSEFDIALADFGISGQPIDGGKVAKQPKISVRAEFK